MNEIMDIGDEDEDGENVGQCEENSTDSAPENDEDSDSDVVEILYQQPSENSLDLNSEYPDEYSQDENDNQVDFEDANVPSFLPKNTVEPDSVGVPSACNGPCAPAGNGMADGFNAQVLQLKRVVALQKQENEHLKWRLESCEREVSMLRVHSRTKQQRIIQTQKSLAQVQEELYMTREKYEARASALENSYRQLCKDVSNSEDALLQARLQLHQLQQRNKLLEDLNNEHARTIEYLKMHLVQMQEPVEAPDDCDEGVGVGVGVGVGGGDLDFQGSALNPLKALNPSTQGSARTIKNFPETTDADYNYGDDHHTNNHLKRQLHMAHEHINALIMELADAIAKSQHSAPNSLDTHENWTLLMCQCKRTQIQNDQLRAQVNDFKRLIKNQRNLQMELQGCKEQVQARERRAADELQQQAQAYESRINDLLHQLQQARINESYARDQYHRVQSQVELLKTQVQMQQETNDAHTLVIASTNVQLQEALAQVESQQCTINELQQAKELLEVNINSSVACNVNANATKNADANVANDNFNAL